MGQEKEISLGEIFAMLWHKAWLIILCVVIGAGVGFSVSRYLINPTYAAKISMYVNNNKDRVESSLNINDLNVSQKLVMTYIEILKSDKVLDKVIEKLNLPYKASTLRGMISAQSVNGTEIFEVKLTTEDPEEAALIANTIAEVAPAEIIRVVKAGDVQLIDEAVANPNPVAPNTMLNTLIAAMLGGILAVLMVFLVEMLDTRVKSVEDLQSTYDLPILGSIPDMLDMGKSRRK